eukprot:TRINITY_DN9086_c0_g1_i7.p1 TRINITY_DN9086_c0_g1~~TRINITY_DN9086_c0_g1_i7.p1  ORF type:complete len:1221 (+),score=186.70 TRINITY_DN9086_c0_g1_i7:112-3774(+)
MLVFLLSIYVLYCQSASVSFQCNFTMSQSSNPFGIFNGILQYDWLNKRTITTFTTSQYKEVVHYNSSGGYFVGQKDGQLQTLTSYSPSCSCSTSIISTSQPVLIKDSPYLDKIDSSTYRPNKGNSLVISVSFGSDGYPSTVKYSDGRTFSYSNCHTQLFDSSLFTIPDGCSCNRTIDVVLVLDRSCSITSSEFVLEKDFTINLVKSFDIDVTRTNLGITNFHTWTWDGPVALTQGITASQVTTGASALQCWDGTNNPNQQCIVTPGWAPDCCGCGTCISCGIVNGADMLATSTRAYSSKVLIILTDGYHNLVLNKNGDKLNRDSRGKPNGLRFYVDTKECSELDSDVSDPCFQGLTNDLEWAVNYSQFKVPGIQIFAVGVGDIPKFHQLQVIAGGNPDHVISTSDWNELSLLVSQLAQMVCPSSTPCPHGCCGFCACESTCVFPDSCAKGNLCLPPSGSCCSPPSNPDPTVCLNESNKCYDYSCDPSANNRTGGCVGTHVSSSFQNLTCTDYHCDPTTGKPVPIPKLNFTCGTNDACTNSVCDFKNPNDPLSMYCKTTAKSCVGTNKCLIYGCDPQVGCITKPLTIPTNTSCTNYTCDPSTGFILTYTRASCCNCSDNNNCTIDTARNGDCACTFTTKNCSGNNKCFRYGCDKVMGCTATPISLPVNTSCLNYVCDPQTGKIMTIDLCCTEDWNLCDDHNQCTIDHKNKCSCTHENVTCPTSGDLCVTTVCDPVAKCVNRPRSDIPPNDNCTTYICNSTSGKITKHVQPKCCPICDDHNECTDDITHYEANCQCTFSPKNCTRGNNPCISYGCDVRTGCTAIPKPVPNNTHCTAWICDSTTGQNVSMDLCCSNMTCDDKDLCTNDIKEDCKCNFIPLTCNQSSNLCQTTSCESNFGCVSTDNPISPNTTCHHFWCDSKSGVISTWTNSTCCPPCVVPDKCHSCEPRSGDCGPVYTYIGDKCGGTDLCQLYSCDPLIGCTSKPKPVPKDTCLTYKCDPSTGNLTATPIPLFCDDKDACTSDSCVLLVPNDVSSAFCNYSSIKNTCDDKNPCTTDSCDKKSGCVYIPKNQAFCDDNNACTTDLCNSTSLNLTYPCVHVDITCNASDVCHEATCIPLHGCVQNYISCPTSDNCTISGCNVTDGRGCYIESAGICGAPVSSVGGLAGGVLGGVLAAALAGTIITSGSAVTAFGQGAGSALQAEVKLNPLYQDTGNTGYNPLYRV